MAVPRINSRRGERGVLKRSSRKCSVTRLAAVTLTVLAGLYIVSVLSLLKNAPTRIDGSNRHVQRPIQQSLQHTHQDKPSKAVHEPAVHPVPDHDFTEIDHDSDLSKAASTSDSGSDSISSSLQLACQQLLKYADETLSSEKDCQAIEPDYRQTAHVKAGECSLQKLNENADETDGTSYQYIPFTLDRTKAQDFLQHHGRADIYKPITAYIEPPLHDTVPGTGSRGKDLGKNKGPDQGTPPEFRIPLPLRPHTPSDLTKYEYTRVQTCNDMPAKFPVDRGLEYDTTTGKTIVWNVGNNPMPADFPQQEAPYCPVEADPFLPWIHDVFPSQDGTKIEFIAQNKRRCRTGEHFTPEVNRLVPQVALMQSISVQRIDERTARELAPELWKGNDDERDEDNDTIQTEPNPRYRLAPLEEASPDGQATRFICRFHALDFSNSPPTTRIVGETLSAYDFNYEYISYRKGNPQTTLISPRGKDTTLFWASNIRFHCPVPVHLQDWVASGATVLSDGSPTLHVDVIPIRTSVRYQELYMSTDVIGPKDTWGLPAFDPVKRWGERNVLPRVEASGRWANIPICKPPAVKDATCNDKPLLTPKIAERPKKPHTLSACLWASAEFKTRGLAKGASTDTADRLKEWIEFHLLVGFDHIYVYDNSGAHTNETSLKPILDLYPADKITRIDWPSIVCNNNIPAHDSTGERSSQYAAENSCRTRYGPFTEWIAAFDTDEYLVPMGKHESLKEVLENLSPATNILSMRSSRGRLRLDKSDKVTDDAIEKKADVTFLEAYNCDSAGIPKKSWADRARKQIYRTNYVLYHFVHYSTVTRGYLQTWKDMVKDGVSTWRRKFGEKPPSERVTDELHEAVMVHTKSLERDMTARYETRCRHDWDKKWQGCWVAFPFPPNVTNSDTLKENYGADGMEYNCYVNDRVENYWIPKLREAMKRREEGWDGTH